MTSTTVAQHTTQPLNFGPEWLRALSTPESTTPTSASSGTTSGSVFKLTATKYRYSKDEILALRSNVTERLSENVKNEILENLKDVETIFRPNILEPLTLTTPSAEETSKMNSLSSYISGRGTGSGRGGNHSQSSQQQQQHDTRGGRGAGSMSNGRGASRGRGGRENTFGANRGNLNSEDTGENGGNDDSNASSSWSSRGGYHSSRGGGSFGNRMRSYDDREQSQSSFRRGSGTRQTSETWRRSRGEDDENPEQNDEPTTPSNGSASWTSRGGQTRRGGSSLEQRTKSSDKWNTNEDRPGQSSSFESNQQRGWRTMPDRDLNSRRPQQKRDRMPEWMDDDNNDGDNQLTNATFEQDGTFTGSSSTSLRQNSNEQQKLQTQSSVDESTSSRGNAPPSKPSQKQDDNKSEKTIPSQIDKAVVNVPTVSEKIVSEPTHAVQQTHASWDDEFEPSDVATLVVESTLADDHDYSPPVSSNATSSTNPLLAQPKQQRIQPPVVIDDKQWFYKDPQQTVQGPFSSADMERWFKAGYFTITLPVKRLGETQFSTIQQLTQELGHLPFRTDIPAPVQQPIVSEPQKFNPMTYASSTSTTANNAYLEDYLMQGQRQPNSQQSMLFNRQTSIPVTTNERKPISTSPMINPQLQAFLASQQHSHSASSLFSSNLANDPAVLYQQQPNNQLQRSISVTNQQNLFDDLQQTFRPISSQSNISSFFDVNLTNNQSQQPIKPDNIMARLAQAMQSHGQQQQEKLEEQRRIEQQRRDLELERFKFEQLRLQREDEERRLLEQQHKLEEELRKKRESSVTMNNNNNNKQAILDQMKEMAKLMEQKKQQQQSQSASKPQAKQEIDPFLAFQQSVQFQKEQQAKIEAQQAENVRRYQQQQQQQQKSQPIPQQTFKLPESANWARHPSQNAEHNQPLNFSEIQKQEQEQERRAREAAQQLAKSDAVNIPHSSSSSSAKPNSWARTLFAGSHSNNTSQNLSSDYETNEHSVPESPITSYNQQATHAPKSRSATSQQSAPWTNASNTTPSTSLQDIQRQQQLQTQHEVKTSQQQPQQQQQQQAHSSSSSHSTPAWGGVFQHSTSSPQSSSSSSVFWPTDNQPSASHTKSSTTSGNKSSTPWTEIKPTAKPTSTPQELTKTEREVKNLFSTDRTQDALSKWAQMQFKDNLQAIDVPTLVQLLKDIDTADEIVEYVQPYIGSVIKSRDFAQNFIAKRKQLLKAEPELDNERLNELAMAPTSSTNNSTNPADEGFQLASSNGQKKKAKKMKGQKIDVKQLGFMVNNRPEQRDDIDRVQM